MNDFEVIRIPKHYVGDNCVQVRFGYNSHLVLFNTSKILFLDNLKIEQTPINAYVTDTRRLAFPYFNIPIYKQKHALSVYHHTHQILDYDKPYISFVDGKFKLNYALKDEDGTALFVSKDLYVSRKFMLPNKEELPSKISENLKTKEEPYIIIDGSSLQVHHNLGISQSEIIEDINRYVSEIADRMPLYSKEMQFPTYNAEFYKDSNLENEVSKVIGPIFFVRTDGENIFIIKFGLNRFREELYSFEFSDMGGIKMLSLEEIKEKHPRIKTLAEPKVSTSLNTEYTEKDIEEAENFVKMLKQI